jgi:hypothetical protein
MEDAAVGDDGEPDVKDGKGEGEEEGGATMAKQEADAQPHGRVEEGDAAADAGEAIVKAVGGQCPCGSGRRYRKCCRKADRQRQRGVGAAACKHGGSASEEDTQAAPGPRAADKDEAIAINAVAAKLEAIAM